MQTKAIIHAAEEGGYWAEVPVLPGCITEGETWEEVIVNLKDAISGWLEVANKSRITESSLSADLNHISKLALHPAKILNPGNQHYYY